MPETTSHLVEQHTTGFRQRNVGMLKHAVLAANVTPPSQLCMAANVTCYQIIRAGSVYI
jgi:hypothetical protein